MIAGAGQVSVLVASALVPIQLDWRKSLAGLPKLLRQMFWVYGAYTAGGILTFGLFSLFGANDMAAGSILSRLVCGANAIFWGVRLSLQWVFDAEPFLTKWWLRVGYHLLTLMFSAFVVFYAWLAFR